MQVELFLFLLFVFASRSVILRGSSLIIFSSFSKSDWIFKFLLLYLNHIVWTLCHIPCLLFWFFVLPQLCVTYLVNREKRNFLHRYNLRLSTTNCTSASFVSGFYWGWNKIIPLILMVLLSYRHVEARYLVLHISVLNLILVLPRLDKPILKLGKY